MDLASEPYCSNNRTVHSEMTGQITKSALVMISPSLEASLITICLRQIQSLIASACNFSRNDTGSCAGSRYSKWYLSTHSRACDNVPKLQDVGMGERTNLEFGTPREHMERQSQRESHAPGLLRAGVRCFGIQVQVALQYLFFQRQGYRESSFRTPPDFSHQ